MNLDQIFLIRISVGQDSNFRKSVLGKDDNNNRTYSNKRRRYLNILTNAGKISTNIRTNDSNLFIYEIIISFICIQSWLAGFILLDYLVESLLLLLRTFRLYHSLCPLESNIFLHFISETLNRSIIPSFWVTCILRIVFSLMAPWIKIGDNHWS